MHDEVQPSSCLSPSMLTMNPAVSCALPIESHIAKRNRRNGRNSNCLEKRYECMQQVKEEEEDTEKRNDCFASFISSKCSKDEHS